VRGDVNNARNTPDGTPTVILNDQFYPSQPQSSPVALLARRRRSIYKRNTADDLPGYYEPPDYQTAPPPPPEQMTPNRREHQSGQQGCSSSGGGGRAGGISTPANPLPPAPQPLASAATADRRKRRRRRQGYRKLDAALEAYANDPRRLGAWVRQAELARPYWALIDKVRALQAEVAEAEAGSSSSSSSAPNKGKGEAGKGADAARQTKFWQLQQELATAKKELAAVRRQHNILGRFGRDIGRRLGEIRLAGAATERRMASILESIVAQLGPSKELEALGRRTLAEAQGPLPPVEAEALTPDASWTAAADVLARHAAEVEKLTGATWLRPMENIESVRILKKAGEKMMRPC
jgi:hypothetical protein